MTLVYTMLQRKNTERRKHTTNASKTFRPSTKGPAPDGNDMMKMLNKSMKTVKFDNNRVFKTIWVTNAWDGSENFLISDKIMNLVGK